MREWGSRYARLVLERCGSNKRKACRVLDISYHTLQTYLRHAAPAEGCRDASPPDGAWPAAAPLAAVHEGPPGESGMAAPPCR
jgi:hypothetical protein